MLPLFPDAMNGFGTWTVGELTLHIKNSLESDDILQNVRVSGELSNVTQSSAGHLYFTMKDSEAALSCVMWRSAAARLTWRPKLGTAVVAHGRISVYPTRGAYQLYVDHLSPAGLGDLHARFEQLRDQLKAEGLFDPERKQSLPRFPRVLGIVTSPQAAALRDVLSILRRRYPLVGVQLEPTLVQGDQAPPQIVAALETLDARDDVDVILVVRGGGSLEELWAFNDERVARAIAACRHPVVSGVGHETDFTIADFVADLRAPTPSAAAELAVPDQAELRQKLQARRERLQQSLQHRLTQARQTVNQQEVALRSFSPALRLDTHRQQVDDLTRRQDRALQHYLAQHRSAVTAVEAQLAALSPLATLQRGYAIVRREDTGLVVHSVDQVSVGDGLRVRVQDGEFGAETRSVE